jgi:hypothetical protein
MIPVIMGIVLVVVLGTVFTASAASSRVLAHGPCSGGSHWRLTLNADHGKIEADNEVRTPQAGQVWRMNFFDNGVKFGSATRTTQSDGSASATRYATNQAGTDNITVRSKNQSTGEVCVSKAKF